MAEQNIASAPDGDELLTTIEDHILDAVNVLVRRACKDNPSEPQIRDNKGDDVPDSGVVQDCEFGLMVLMADDWLSKRNHVSGELTDKKKIQTLTTSLVLSTVQQVTAVRNNSFARGRLEKDVVFFSGAPYTFHRNDKKKAVFSANLDAAMLIVAFLTAALEKFDEELSKAPMPEDLQKLNLASLRDAALFVCNEGLRYAIECRVTGADGGFEGYTCDPETNKDASISLPDADRLFFSWTTCETINDLLRWRQSYLERLNGKSSVSSIIAEIKSQLVILEEDLEATSKWCNDVFYPLFKNLFLSVPPISRTLVEAARYKPDESLNDELQGMCSEIEKFVQHVYSVSHYAAIRSIEPVGMQIDEVGQILLILDNLVGQYILTTGLDAAVHEDVYKTLTRFYSLGITPTTYRDDAYFPLVVRALSGLLRRTIDGLHSDRREIKKLIDKFQLSLKNRYQNLLMRQPLLEQDGDDKLWSIATGKPYVLYATQRTVFALIEYMKFLEKMDEFEKDEPENLPVKTKMRESDLRSLFAERLAEVLIGSAVNQVLDEFPVFGDPLRRNLPEPEWVQQVILSWLANVKLDFEGKGAQKLDQLVSQLVLVFKQWRELAPSKTATNDPRDKYKKFAECVGLLFDIAGIGPKLSEIAEQRASQEDLPQILFEHIFLEFVGNGSLLSDLFTGKSGLSGHIRSAHKYAMDLRKE